jgi:hypothetical protein
MGHSTFFQMRCKFKNIFSCWQLDLKNNYEVLT